jgi:hypothetical protein
MFITNLVDVIWEWFYSLALLQECLKKEELLGRGIFNLRLPHRFSLIFAANSQH